MTYTYTRPRGRILAMEQGPGPCCVALPPLTGHAEHDPRSVHPRGPAYPFGTCHLSPRPPCSPGPCHYPDPSVGRTGVKNGRSYTIYPRLQDLKAMDVPAPGTHDLVSLSVTGTRAPAYSFGVVCPPLSPYKIPGPDSYTLGVFGRSVESLKRQSPSYSISSRRHKGSIYEDFRKTPGPGTYRRVEVNRYKEMARPQYSLTARNFMPDDPTIKPGPGAHCPETVRAHLYAYPSYSFGLRHSEYEYPIILNDED